MKSNPEGKEAYKGRVGVLFGPQKLTLALEAKGPSFEKSMTSIKQKRSFKWSSECSCTIKNLTALSQDGHKK